VRRAAEISGPWSVRLEGLDGTVEERTMDRLVDLSQVGGLDDFSGTAVYTTTFEPPEEGAVLLDLGAVREISEVRLNGAELGVRWYGRHRYDVTDHLRPGENELVVTVTTLAFNHFRAQEGNAMAQHWIGRSRQKDPLPSGLIGPVTLTGSAPGPGGTE
jgi:hypothetical protein